MDAEQIRFIREEVKRQINIILNASAGDNDSQTETIEELFPGMPGINTRPVMHPYGFVSRATPGTISVTAKVGDHFGNRMVMGHRDKARPSVENGETMLYNSSGQQIYVKNGDIIFTSPLVHIGSSSADQPFVLGTIFQEFTNNLLQFIIEHQHVTSAPGSLTSTPVNDEEFLQIQESPIQDGAILSDSIFGEKGGS